MATRYAEAKLRQRPNRPYGAGASRRKEDDISSNSRYGCNPNKEAQVNFLKRGLVAKFVFLVAASSALAENRQDTLFKRLNRPATVAGHNSPSTFAIYLDQVNERKTVLVPSKEGSNPIEADVWVLFFQNEAEVDAMPKLIKDVYNAIPKGTGRPASKYIEFQLSSGGPKAASFHFLEHYGTDSEDVVACKAAVAVYSGVIGSTNSHDRKNLTKKCESLM